MEENNNQKKVELSFFRLDKEGDFINARIMHKSTETIEKFDVHPIMSEGKRRRVKCLGEKCPLCANGAEKQERIFIHLYDYGTGSHLVWDRTNKIMDKLKEIENDWGGLNAVPVKITRDSNEFPTYSVSPLPPSKFAPVDEDSVDVEVSYRCGLYRSADEMEEYIKTGVMPPHKKKEKEQYVPKKKETYFVPKNVTNNVTNNATKDEYADVVPASDRQFESIENEDLPF